MASPHSPYTPPFPPSPVPTYATPTPPASYTPFPPPQHASPLTFTTTSGYPPPPPAPEHSSSFSPFFTLISNPASTVHKHPIVHYVFSDDDFDPVTETTLAAAEEAITTPTSGPNSRQGSGSGRPVRPTKDRVVIVDVGNDGETVVAAHSLSKEWQIVGVNISSAPQWMASPAGGEDGSGTAAAATGGGGLMLTIEGTDVGLQGAKKTENLHELVEVFNERMALLKRVIEYGEKLGTAS